jgi:hypothetical protein
MPMYSKPASPKRSRGPENAELGGLVRKVRQQDVLVLLHPRHVGVRVDGEPVGADFQHAVDRRGERRGRLVRKAVDEVEVDARKSEGARVLDEAPRGLVGLDSVDRLLTCGSKS